jgi:hypothetical protein
MLNCRRLETSLSLFSSSFSSSSSSWFSSPSSYPPSSFPSSSSWFSFSPPFSWFSSSPSLSSYPPYFPSSWFSPSPSSSSWFSPSSSWFSSGGFQDTDAAAGLRVKSCTFSANLNFWFLKPTYVTQNFTVDALHHCFNACLKHFREHTSFLHVIRWLWYRARYETGDILWLLHPKLELLVYLHPRSVHSSYSTLYLYYQVSDRVVTHVKVWIHDFISKWASQYNAGFVSVKTKLYLKSRLHKF